MTDTPRLRVTAFVHAHLPELTDLWVEAWSRAMPTLDFEARRAWFVDHLSGLHAGGTEIWCAFLEKNGALAGFFTLAPNGFVDQIAVRHELWGQGIAPALLAEAMRRSSGTLSLEVNQDNLRAVRLYEREGFLRDGGGVNPRSGLKTWRYVWRASRPQR